MKFPLRPRFSKPLLGLVALFVSIGISPAQTTGFEESDGFAPEADVVTAPGWKGSAPAAAVITDEVARTGAQSLQIAATSADVAARRSFTLSKDGIVFLDFAILPVADATSAPVSTVDANGAVLGFLATDGRGSVVAVPAAPKKGTSPAPAVDTGYTFDLDEEQHATDWIQVTIREDVKAGKWDLFLDDKLVLVDQPLAPVADKKGASLALFPNAAGPAFVDDVTIGTNNPLFPDADRDGIPDAVEKVNGTNPFANDRALLVGSGQQTAIQAFRTNATVVKTNQPVNRTLYVDNSVGNDKNTGFLSYKSKKDGPFRTLAAAFQETDDQTLVVILPGNKSYDWPEQIPTRLKELNILTLDTVNVQ